MNRNEIFESYPIPKALASLSIPTIMGMLVMIIYNIADTFFVGLTNDVNQIASVTLTTPVFMLLMALGGIFGVGCGSYISRLMGKKDFEKVKNTSAFGFYGGLTVGLIYLILGMIFMPQILKMLGATENTYAFSKAYLNILTLGAPFVMLSFSMGQTIRAEGFSKEAMIGMMIGTILNIVLDPIFILVFDMGVAGAGLATIISNIVSVIYYAIHMLSKKSSLSISIKDVKVDKELLTSVLAIGAPASLNNLLMSVSGILLNNFAVSYGDTVLASLGVVNRLMLFPVMILVGLCQGAQPLIGYNYASKNYKRMNGVIKLTAIIGTIMGVVFTGVLVLFGEYAVKAFLQESKAIELSVQFLRVVVMSVPILGIQFILTGVFQATGKAVPSLILSISRQGLIFVPVLFIGNAIAGLNGIVYAQPVADIVTTFVGVVLFKVAMKGIKEIKENDIKETV